LHEGLELVTRVSRCSFNSENTLNRLFTHDGITKAVSDVGELLVIGPIDFPFVTSIVIVVGSGGPVFKEFILV
jgi:hypothetical protein